MITVANGKSFISVNAAKAGGPGAMTDRRSATKIQTTPKRLGIGQQNPIFYY